MLILIRLCFGLFFCLCLTSYMALLIYPEFFFSPHETPLIYNKTWPLSLSPSSLFTSALVESSQVHSINNIIIVSLGRVHWWISLLDGRLLWPGLSAQCSFVGVRRLRGLWSIMWWIYNNNKWRTTRRKGELWCRWILLVLLLLWGYLFTSSSSQPTAVANNILPLYRYMCEGL